MPLQTINGLLLVNGAAVVDTASCCPCGCTGGCDYIWTGTEWQEMYNPPCPDGCACNSGSLPSWDSNTMGSHTVPCEATNGGNSSAPNATLNALEVMNSWDLPPNPLP